MTAEVSLNGSRIVSGSIEIPQYGLWAADVMMADDSQLPSSGPLVLGDLTLQSFAFRTFAFAGARKSRLVGGFAGGWMQPVAAQEYANPAGLTLSLVLSDLAAAIGEKVKVVTDQTFGAFFFRKGTGPSKHALDQLVGRTWWVDPVSGVVQVGATRRSDAIASNFTVNDYDGTAGRAVISTENPSDWMPGRTWTTPTVTATQTISAVRHAIVDGKLRTEVLTAGPESDRFIGPIREMIEDLAPEPTYHGLWEYAVQTTDGTVVDCSPTQSSILAAPFPLPQHVTGVVMRFGIPGAKCKPTVGSSVFVMFANGDPSLPRILGYDTTDAQSITLQSGSEGAARVGDTVNDGYLAYSATLGLGSLQYFPGTTAGLVAATAYAAGLSPPGVVLPMTAGTISSGSSTVTIG